MCHNGEGLPASVGSVLFGLLHGRPQIQPFNEFYFLMNPRQADNVGYFASPLVQLTAPLHPVKSLPPAKVPP
jgi:hypothetical protein